MADWEEVSVAKNEKRHELVLTGGAISEKIDKFGLSEEIYTISNLNFLEISRTSLTSLSEKLGDLHNLTNLVLHHNKLNNLPSAIGNLQKLKIVDLSGNELQHLPVEIGQLSELQSLNLSCNKLVDCPEISDLHELHILDISHNELEALPEGITETSLSQLANIAANNNMILEVPSEISNLTALKIFNISDNKLSSLPPQLSECLKLKELKYGGNKLKDRKLAKMTNQYTTKSVLDYLKVILDKERASEKQGKTKGKKKGSKSKGASDDIEDLSQNVMKVLHFKDEAGCVIQVNPNVGEVRPYIVCCIIKNLCFTKASDAFKRFITLQTRFHETVCQKRQTATIATHDLKAVKGNLKYEARPPPHITLVPLGKMKETRADRLVASLRHEADEIRKDKKRNAVSGIHKYLDLLKGKQLYPCLVDSEGTVISFPPITNANITKVSKETTDILVEVTSSTSLEVCKNVMDQLLHQIMELGIGAPDTEQEDGAGEGAVGGPKIGQGQECLVIEQVKILNEDGGLKVLYPSRVDLQSSQFRVDRNYE